MGLDLWFRADVARILQATHETMVETAAMVGAGQTESPQAAGYQAGFEAALRAVATAFGLTAVGASDSMPDFVGRIPPVAAIGSPSTYIDG